jgi:thiol:disulfide interchange protein DsbA
MFFDFSCPYCALYHEPMVRWTQTTPNSIRTLFIPVVNPADKVRMAEQVMAAKCYFAAYVIASQEQIIRFVTSVYQSQQSGISLTSAAVWVDALKFSGINNKKFSEGVKNKSFDSQVQMAAWKTAQYDLVATPSVAVGGRYVLIPDDVNGDPQMFFNILNGLTSEIV